jgi:hypothetical protein
MRTYTQKVVAIVTFAAVGCSGAINEPPPGTRLELHRFRTDGSSFAYVSGMRQSQRLIVRDAATWLGTWASISNSVPSQPAPNVNFATQMVVVAALGERTSGGYTIRVDSALRTTDGLTIWIGTVSAGAHCGTVTMLTQPVDIASLPRVDGAVRFVDVPSVVDCE